MSELVSTNPGENYTVIGEVAISSDAEIETKLEQANSVKTAWKELGIEQRIEFVAELQSKKKRRG